MMDVDYKSRKILYYLDFNARMRSSSLAKKVGIQKAQVKYRIKTMIEKRIIQYFYPALNIYKLGYIFSAFFVFKIVSPADVLTTVPFIFSKR